MKKDKNIYTNKYSLISLHSFIETIKQKPDISIQELSEIFKLSETEVRDILSEIRNFVNRSSHPRLKRNKEQF